MEDSNVRSSKSRCKRRRSLRVLAKAGAGSALLSPLVAIAARTAQAAEPPVTYFTYGGAWKQAISAAFFDPFTKKTGSPVQYQEPYTFAKLRAMHEAKAQQIDIAGLSGMDVYIAARIKTAGGSALVQLRAANGTAVLLNSHLLSEIELTCDRVAVLRNGKCAAFGRVEDLTRRAEQYKMVATPIDDALVAAFRETGAVVERVNGHMILSVEGVQHLNALVDKLRAGGGMLSELAPVRSTLEDVFVDLVRATETEAPKP